MLLLASDTTKTTPECLTAAQRAVEMWELETKGTSKEGSMADAIQQLGKQGNLERIARGLFENQESCLFYASEASDPVLRLLTIKQIPDHPEHGVTRRSIPFDPEDMKALVMRPPPDEALEALTTPGDLKDLTEASVALANCNYPGLTVVDSVLISGTGVAVATKMGLDGLQYQDRLVRPALIEIKKEDACNTNARTARNIAKKVKDLGATIISDTRTNRF